MRYRCCSEIVEAVQWNPHGKDGYPDWFWEHFMFHPDINSDNSLSIRTVLGVMRAKPGDWVVRGATGALHSCPRDAFPNTYEAVE